VRIPGGIRVRIAAALVAIVGIALGTAYLIVVPSLERRLVDARLHQLEKSARPLANELPGNRFLWPDAVEQFAVEANARVVAFDVLSRTPPALAVVADSRLRSSRDVSADPVALRALESGELESGWVETESGDVADVAIPLESDAILLFQAPLADSLATVRLVQRRLLLATGFALALAFVLGLTAAGMLANRLRRLEVAAERIAGGDFDRPIVDAGDDEIGQLAQTFDRMRVQLARLDDARKAFVANASHELRTPLFSIGGFLELLADEDLDDETRREFIVTMQGQVERLTKLSSDLLDLSRVDAGQLSVVREPTSLGEIVRTLAGELEHVAGAAGKDLATEVEGEVWCLGDAKRIVQIGSALVMNAIVHTPPGTRVTLRARRRGDRAELVVEDDGPGIPEAHREAVFERFYRIEGGKASGSGLGLSIARELARLLDGNVRLEPAPGLTTFTLDLSSTDPVDAFPRENGEPALATEPRG
jgi:signal transduction histidine kinase